MSAYSSIAAKAALCACAGAAFACLCGWAPRRSDARPPAAALPATAREAVPPGAAGRPYPVFDDASAGGSFVGLADMDSREPGDRAIAALLDSGRFAAAARFALAGEPALRRDFVNAAFLAWGRAEPESALESALAVAEPADRDVALHSVFSGWARAEPRALAELALRFPDGDEKTAALTKSLRRWMVADPWAAGDWILGHAEVAPVVEAMFRAEDR